VDPDQPVLDLNDQPPGATTSERQTAGWDLRNAVRNYSTLVAAQVVVAAFSFASVWFVTRQLGTDGYGGVVAVLAASQIAQILINWSGISLARHGVEEFVATGQITESFWARTAVFLPNTVILLLFSAFWLPVTAVWLKLPTEALWFVAAHSVASAVWLHIQYAMQAAKLPRMQAVMQAAERILIFGALVVLNGAGRLDSLMAVAAYVAAPVVMTLAGLVAIRNLFSWRVKFTRTAIKRLLVFSVPLIPYSLIGYFSTNYLDAIFISQYLSRSDLGVYSVAYQINGILMQFPLLAGSLLMPLFVTLRTSGKGERVSEYLRDVVPLLTFVGGVSAIVAALALTFLIPFVFGEQAAGSVTVIWILMSAAVLAVPTLIGFAPFTNAVSATYIATIAALAAAAVNLVANYLLIPRYGLVGCAWATVLAYAASLIVFLAFGRFRFSIKLRWIIPAMLPALVASLYASLTGNLPYAAALAFLIAFAIVIVWHKAAANGIRMIKDLRSFAAG